jgi:pyrroloquinoline quinone biosynthesis protein D
LTITPTSRPRLVPHARLRFDRHGGRWMLLAPERGLVLSPTALAIVERMDGTHTVDAIAAELAARSAASRRRVLADLLTFLERLADRCLVELAP